jgi:hypothetical protein
VVFVGVDSAAAVSVVGAASVAAGSAVASASVVVVVSLVCSDSVGVASSVVTGSAVAYVPAATETLADSVSLIAACVPQPTVNPVAATTSNPRSTAALILLAAIVPPSTGVALLGPLGSLGPVGAHREKEVVQFARCEQGHRHDHERDDAI